jgi:hypothetical protein
MSIKGYAMDIEKQVQADIDARRKNSQVPLENVYEKILDLAICLKQHLVETDALTKHPALPGPKQHPTPQLDKVRNEIINLHGQGYHAAAIARTLNLPSSSVQDWLKRLGLKPNKVGKDSPGYIKPGRAATTMNGSPKKYQPLTPKQHNEKLKEARNERQNQTVFSSPHGGVSEQGSGHHE